MSEDQIPKPRLRTPRWIWLVLVLSLGANLAVAGIVAGRVMRAERVDPELGRFYSQVVAVLPEERRAAARSVLLAGGSPREARAAFRGEIMQATDAVTAALTAEPFDPEALRSALANRMEIIRASFSGRQERMVALAETLSVEDRSLLAAEMRRRVERRMKRWSGR